jgi:hypothetical protein
MPPIRHALLYPGEVWCRASTLGLPEEEGPPGKSSSPDLAAGGLPHTRTAQACMDWVHHMCCVLWTGWSQCEAQNSAGANH